MSRIREDIRTQRSTSLRKDTILRALMNDIINKRLFIRTNTGMLVAVSEITGVYDPKEIAKLLNIDEKDVEKMVADAAVEAELVAPVVEKHEVDDRVSENDKFSLHEVGS